MISKMLCKVLKRCSQPSVHEVCLLAQFRSFQNVYFRYKEAFTSFMKLVSEVESKYDYWAKYYLIYIIVIYHKIVD